MNKSFFTALAIITALSGTSVLAQTVASQSAQQVQQTQQMTARQAQPAPFPGPGGFGDRDFDRDRFRNDLDRDFRGDFESRHHDFDDEDRGGFFPGGPGQVPGGPVPVGPGMPGPVGQVPTGVAPQSVQIAPQGYAAPVMVVPAQ